MILDIHDCLKIKKNCERRKIWGRKSEKKEGFGGVWVVDIMIWWLLFWYYGIEPRDTKGAEFYTLIIWYIVFF